MRKIYFDFDNGDVVKPDSIIPPPYYAVLDDKFRVREIYICYLQQNINAYGEKWLKKTLKEAGDEWRYDERLMRSLKKFIRKNIFKLLFNDSLYETKNNDFVYYKCYERE